MRHLRGNRKLSRATDQRLALLRSIVRSLFIHGRVKVTAARAQEARRMAEKLITASRANNLTARRKVESVLHDRKIVTQIFKTFPERYEGRPGGYTRITKVGARRGDAAPLAVLELI
jgi:large subunit ribosomal protein L17